MAMQTGIGLSKILVLAGAGYTGTILLKNGKLSDLIGELQGLVKGLEKSGESTNSESDPLAAQVLLMSGIYFGTSSRGDLVGYSILAVEVQWLAQEIRQLASTRQITVLNGSSGRTDVTSLIVPAATLGALGYGYMWWKGFSFSDLMYVTKRNMATAVANLTKHLESVSETLAKTKRHLTQRIQNLDGKMDEQREMSKLIMNEVRDTRGDIDKITNELFSLRDSVFSLEDKMVSFEDKQELTLDGVTYLLEFAAGKTRAPELSQFMQKKLKLCGKSRGQLPSSDRRGLQGVFGMLTEDMTSRIEVKSITDGNSNGLAMRKLDEGILS